MLRDLGEPDLRIERYHVPTWIDYVRHNQRRTNADAANSAAIRALEIEGYEPVVHRRIERRTGSLPDARTPRANSTRSPIQRDRAEASRARVERGVPAYLTKIETVRATSRSAFRPGAGHSGCSTNKPEQIPPDFII